jgi:hypothetical protein
MCICNLIHKKVNGFPRYKVEDIENGTNISQNGVYICFEKSEKVHEGDRIVRVGTHRGDNNLLPRLREHFVTENRNRSIFRKNIGRAFISKNYGGINNDFYNYWNLDLTLFKNRQNAKKVFAANITELENKSIEMEKKVSEYIRNNISFCVFEIEDRKDRLNLEKKIIATVNSCESCRPSEKWLGKYSPKNQIRDSGLWLVQGLNAKQFTKSEFEKSFSIAVKIKN